MALNIIKTISRLPEALPKSLNAWYIKFRLRKQPDPPPEKISPLMQSSQARVCIAFMQAL